MMEGTGRDFKPSLPSEVRAFLPFSVADVVVETDLRKVCSALTAVCRERLESGPGQTNWQTVRL